MESDQTNSRRKRHPIQVVSRRTGLSADVLRAWEKRYGVVEPGRSEGGRRLYSDQDIERLRLLHRASAAGRRISQIAPLSTDQLAAMVEEDEREEAEAPARLDESAAAAVEVSLEAALSAVERMDARELEVVLNRAVVTLNAMAVVEEVVAPLLRRIGELWEDEEVCPAHEHVASAVVRRVLGRVLEAAEASNTGPLLVVGTPAGQQHEFGAMFAAATAASEGWRVTYLGADLPAADIALAVRAVGAQAVALSIVYPEDGAALADELRRLREELPAAVTLLVGGRAVAVHRSVIDEIKALALPDLGALRSTLAELG